MAAAPTTAYVATASGRSSVGRYAISVGRYGSSGGISAGRSAASPAWHKTPVAAPRKREGAKTPPVRPARVRVRVRVRASARVRARVRARARARVRVRVRVRASARVRARVIG